MQGIEYILTYVTTVHYVHKMDMDIWSNFDDMSVKNISLIFNYDHKDIRLRFN